MFPSAGNRHFGPVSGQKKLSYLTQFTSRDLHSMQLLSTLFALCSSRHLDVVSGFVSPMSNLRNRKLSP